MTLLIVDLWQYCVCIRSGVTLCTLLIVLYLCRMWQYGFWSHIGILMFFLVTEHGCTAGSLFSSQCPYGTILLTMYSMMWDWRVSRSGPILFYWSKLLDPFLSSTVFPVIFFLSIDCYCGAGVFRLTGCISLSPSLALPTSFNN